MSNIYEQLWNIDQAHNGCTVATREGENWIPKNADIKLDEQVKSSGKRNIDLANKPLFFDINDEILERDTYVAFIKLLDNYIVNYRMEETDDYEERQEIEEFLDLILQTEVMKKAYEYITTIKPLTPEKFKQDLKRIWFTVYTNHYRGRSTSYCSGFEHVFVGEGKYNIRHGAPETLGEISGYHSWIKFYLDEINSRVNFLGYKYDLQGNEGIENPNVVTLQMLWYHTDIYGNVRTQLFKKKGGFFVGTSPECEIALGTVAFYESIAGYFKEKRNVTINGSNYNLIIYRNTEENGQLGKYIRSFYPQFLGKDQTAVLTDRPSIRAVSPLEKNDKSIIITRALINPHGRDTGNEWVELKNTSGTPISLENYELRDKLGRPQKLKGNLEDVRQINITRFNHHSMQLGNKGGNISLYKGSELVAIVHYSKAKAGKVYEF